MRKLEYHHLLPHDELIDVGLEGQATNITKEETTQHYVLCAS